MNTPEWTSDLKRAIAEYRRVFAADPGHAAMAPGRVNLIGDHTDYSGGFVLPMAIDSACVAVGDRRAVGPAELHTCDIADQHWDRYPRGVCAIAGVHIRAVVASGVPIGGGLSSSAALECAVAMLIESATGETRDRRAWAEVCRRAEHEFAGVPCGIMDQLASLYGEVGCALRIDCQSQEIEAIPIPHSCAFIIADSGVRHALAKSEYPERRAACELAARLLSVPTLRCVDAHRLRAMRATLGEVLYRRASHVVNENARVLEACEALRAGDLPRLGALMNASHESLRDLFQVSCAELDELVGIARGVAGVLGARMTGGGFGGCCVIVADANAGPRAALEIRHRYRESSGRDCAPRIVRAMGPARVLTPPCHHELRET